MTFVLGLMVGAAIGVIYSALLLRISANRHAQDVILRAHAALVILRCHARDRGDFRDVRLISRVLDPEAQEAGA